jgi:hypothetical protein
VLFAVQENKFSGTIPTELGLLKQLKELRLDQNVFSGTIPPQLGTLENLGKKLVSAFCVVRCVLQPESLFLTLAVAPFNRINVF